MVAACVEWSNCGRSSLKSIVVLCLYEQIWAANKDANAKEAAAKVAMAEIAGVQK